MAILHTGMHFVISVIAIPIFKIETKAHLDVKFFMYMRLSVVDVINTIWKHMCPKVFIFFIRCMDF